MKTKFQTERAEMLHHVGLCIGEIARSNNSSLIPESTVTAVLHLVENSNCRNYHTTNKENKFALDVLGEIAFASPEWISPHLDRIMTYIETAVILNNMDTWGEYEQYCEAVLSALTSLVQGIYVIYA